MVGDRGLKGKINFTANSQHNGPCCEGTKGLDIKMHSLYEAIYIFQGWLNTDTYFLLAIKV